MSGGEGKKKKRTCPFEREEVQGTNVEAGST